MRREEAKEHIEQIRREQYWLDDPARSPADNPLMGRLRRALDQLAVGIFEHSHHYVFELTQNADDNNYPDNAERDLKFVLLESDPTGTPGSRGCLCVINDETGFERLNVESLCDIGNSTKKGNREGYIGEKGIGFKSVFLISDRPHVISNGYSFHFRRSDCDAGLGYIVPHWDDNPPITVKGHSTAILLPLRGDSDVDVAAQLQDIEPECVLFLRRLRRIELNVESSSWNRTMRCVGEDGIVSLDTSTYFVHRAEHPCDHIREPKREQASSTSVTVALPLGRPAAFDGRVFAFLPTEVRTGLPFLINADFLLPANRERILPKLEWNSYLVKCAATTLVEAFHLLRKRPEHSTSAYCYLPVDNDLLPGMNLFAPLVATVQTELKQADCILTACGDYTKPANARLADPLSRRLLSENPPALGVIQLAHPELELFRDRIEPLGVERLSIPNVLELCNDATWLSKRGPEWWEVLFELLSKNRISAEAVSTFPLLRCQDGICRRPTNRSVFIQPAGATLPSFPEAWPTVHLFDAELQQRLQKNDSLWSWLNRTARLRPLSIPNYITGNLLDWMCAPSADRSSEQLIEATGFVASNLPKLQDHHQTLREKLPWILADGRVLAPSQRGGRKLVTPECLEGAHGWNWVFISEHDRSHFWQLSDAYVAEQPTETRKVVCNLMRTCGANDYPDPAKISCGNGSFDWCPPRWLRDLEAVPPSQNVEEKLLALERWIGRFKPENFAKFLTKDAADWVWNETGRAETSEFGDVLTRRPWLRSTKAYVSPAVAFADTPEIREFMGDSVGYNQTELDIDLLGKLGLRIRLTAATLIGLLRQMRDIDYADEALVVRIYQRLNTLNFDPVTFRQEPLVFVTEPSARWMESGNVFWADAGDLFDDLFGYASLTYENEDLHGFFVDKLGIQEAVPAEKLGEVWLQMSGDDAHTAEVVEMRLQKILPEITKMADSAEPWWSNIQRQLKVWTTAGQFEAPESVFIPDHALAEKLFARTASIAWRPRSIRNVDFLRLLRSLGCRSLTESLKSRLTSVVTEDSIDPPIFLTSATKDALLCWLCDGNGWKERSARIEQLLRAVESRSPELKVEYWLDGLNDCVAGNEVDAYWACDDRKLCLRVHATLKAQQAATANTIATQFNRLGKQHADTIYRLLGLEPADARRELAERKWELTSEQRSWLQSIGYHSELIDTSEEPAAQPNRESRAALTSRPGSTTSNATTQEQSAQTDKPSEEPPGHGHATDSQARDVHSESGVARASSDAAANANQRAGRSTEARQPHTREKQLKSPNSDAEFIHVAAHTRSRPTARPRQQTGSTHGESANPLSRVSQATKAEIEETAVQLILRQFKIHPELSSFNSPIDRRKENKGYDLYAAKPGQVLRIEIKAHLRESKSVFVTQGEWQECKRIAQPEDRWELWNVENLAADAGQVRITRYRRFPKDALRDSGYWIDLTKCQSEAMR